MAIVATLMATPVFEWVFRRYPKINFKHEMAAVSGVAGTGN
jgi:hypothetical protein